MSEAIPTRPLGMTGHEATLFGLGGEGALRTTGRMDEALAVVNSALNSGVNYFDTSPLYEQSEEYLGVALAGRRAGVFLATKTHDRTRDGSLRLLDASLSRLRTDVIDLWQLHDLRTHEDLDRVFSTDGAVRALERAREAGLVRHVGLTGHYDPEILLQAMQRFPFDTVLVALNAADVHHHPFATTVVAEAARRGMGIIGMKVAARGKLLHTVSIWDAMGYVLSVSGVSLVIVGCSTPAEVEQNARVAREFIPLTPGRCLQLEEATRTIAARVSWYRRPLDPGLA